MITEREKVKMRLIGTDLASVSEREREKIVELVGTDLAPTVEIEREKEGLTGTNLAPIFKVRERESEREGERERERERERGFQRFGQ
ncbi:MAG: hypothetical protein KTM48_04155 [Wolbachia endosymbiont of Pissodes strobi]|nr:hypothetical protein [Wolbachia endosymbiont of Pissodes strobi]